MATRNGSARWQGDLESGSGRVTVGNGIFEGDYTAKTRFGDEQEGTNPEELLAAAHAACFTMALSLALTEAGHPPTELNGRARAQLRTIDGAPTIAAMQLEVEGQVDGVDQAEFERIAEQAKRGCPVSRALGAVNEITLKATLT